MSEIELKFALDGAAATRLVGARALAGLAPSRRRIVSTYFDTPECELAAHGMALRLRRRAGARTVRWIAGLKAGHSGTGGLHAREEWEFEHAEPVIDLALFAATPLARLADAGTLHRRLVPAFRVEVMRTTWTVQPRRGVRLEVALDMGRVESRGRRETLREMEIECVEGDAGSAFELARRLLREVALRPSAVTKAQRGYRLFRHEARAPRKARPVMLEPGMPASRAARLVVGAGLDQLQANEDGVLASRDPEFVHQARIALRRLRGSLRLFREAVGSRRSKRWRARLTGVARALGGARDWDVLCGETLPRLGAAFADEELQRDLTERAAAIASVERRAARVALRSPRYAATILEISRWLAQPARRRRGERPLEREAARQLRKRHHRLLRDARRLDKLTAAERHRVRIDAKRLRYGAEALASLFAEGDAHDYLEALENLQDVLGAANDAITARALLPSLAAPPGFVRHAQRDLTRRARPAGATLTARMHRLRSAPHFWRASGNVSPQET
jgi:inorganic triphosphatase YgiF